MCRKGGNYLLALVGFAKVEQGQSEKDVSKEGVNGVP